MSDDRTLPLFPLPPEDHLAVAAAALVYQRLRNAARPALSAAEDRLCDILADIRRRAPTEAMRVAIAMALATHARAQAITDHDADPVLALVACVKRASLLWPIREMLARKRPTRGGTDDLTDCWIGDHRFALRDAYLSSTYSVRAEFRGGLITRDGRPFCYVATHDTYGHGLFFVHDAGAPVVIDTTVLDQAFRKPAPDSVFDLFFSLAEPYFGGNDLARRLRRHAVYTDGEYLYERRVLNGEMKSAIDALRMDGYGDAAILNCVCDAQGLYAALDLFDALPPVVFRVPLDTDQIRAALNMGLVLPPHLRRLIHENNETANGGSLH